MDYMTTKAAAELWGLQQRTVQKYCAKGIIPDCLRHGRAWLIPACAVCPAQTDLPQEHSPSASAPGGKAYARLLKTQFQKGSYCSPPFAELSSALRSLDGQDRFDCLQSLVQHMIMTGDFEGFSHLRREFLAPPYQTEEQEVQADAVYALVAVAMFDSGRIPGWLTGRDFRNWSPSQRPFLLHLNARCMFMLRQLDIAKAVAESYLALTPAPSEDLYLTTCMRLLCAAVCNEQGDDEGSRRWIEAALERALPQGILGPFIELHALLGGSLERCMKDHYPAELAHLLKMQDKAGQGWIRFYHRYHDVDTGEHLSLTEFYAGRYLEHGMSYAEAADRLDLTPGQINAVVRSLYEKKNIHSKRDIRILPKKQE